MKRLILILTTALMLSACTSESSVRDALSTEYKMTDVVVSRASPFTPSVWRCGKYDPNLQWHFFAKTKEGKHVEGAFCYTVFGKFAFFDEVKEK